MKNIGPEYESMRMCVYVGMLVCVSVYMYVHVFTCWEGLTRKKANKKPRIQRMTSKELYINLPIHVSRLGGNVV